MFGNALVIVLIMLVIYEYMSLIAKILSVANKLLYTFDSAYVHVLSPHYIMLKHNCQGC